MIILIGFDSALAAALLRAVTRLTDAPVVLVAERPAPLEPQQVMQLLAVEFCRPRHLLKPYEVSPGTPLALPSPRPAPAPRTCVGEGGHRRKERDYG